MANFPQLFFIVLASCVCLTVSSKCPENGNWTFLAGSSKCISPLALPGGPGNLKQTGLPGGAPKPSPGGPGKNPLPGGPGKPLPGGPGNAFSGGAANLKQTADEAASACAKSGMMGSSLIQKIVGRRSNLNLIDSSANSTVLSIQSAQEGQALVEYFKEFIKNNSNQAFSGGVWIEGRRLKGGMDFSSEFTNWEKGYPTSNASNECVVMNINGSMIGQMRDVPCQEKNYVWCETPANQTLDEVVTNLRQIIAQLKEKPFPTGYVYMQHTNQPPPSNLWPKMKWVEVIVDPDADSTSVNPSTTVSSSRNNASPTTEQSNSNVVTTTTTTTPSTAGFGGRRVRKTRDADAEEDLTPAFAKGRIWKATR